MKNILILAASPRKGKTTAGSIARWLKKGLEDLGEQVRLCSIKELESPDRACREWETALGWCDLLILTFPLFVDTPPAQLLALMRELLASDKAPLKGKELVALVHSGYLKPVQREGALDICRAFAARSGMKLVFASGFGGTSPIGGRPLDEAGWFGAHVRKSLDALASHIHSGNGEHINSGKGGAKKLEARINRSPLRLPTPLMAALVNLVRKDD